MMNMHGTGFSREGKYLAAYTLYAVVSTYIFLLNTSGFGWLATAVAFPLGYTIIGIVLFVSSFFVKMTPFLTGKSSKLLMTLVAAAQVIVLLTNYGDCGEGTCPANINPNRLAGEWFMLFWVAYFVVLFIFVLQPFINSKKLAS